METTTIEIKSYDPETEESLKIVIEGLSDMPFWNHDLKFKAVIALLESIDRKHFYEDGRHEEFHQYMKEIRDLLDIIQFDQVLE